MTERGRERRRTATIEEIVTRACQAEDAGADPLDVLMSFYADPVDVSHIPALPSDRSMTKEQIISGTRMQIDAYRKAMPDYRRISKFTIENDSIVCESLLQGTLPDGTEIKAPMTVTYRVVDGEIPRFAARVEPSLVGLLGQVLAAGGLSIGDPGASGMNPGFPPKPRGAIEGSHG